MKPESYVEGRWLTSPDRLYLRPAQYAIKCITLGNVKANDQFICVIFHLREK